jgi:hypothetical protein
MLNLIALAALPDGAAFKDYVLVFAGNIFIVIMVVRAIMLYLKREWGGLFGHLAAGVLVFGLVYANNAAIAVMRGFWGLISGTS